MDRDASCRRCRVYCDWIIDPVGCLGCSRLYAYDARDGRRYAGCVERVHGAEVDLRILEACAEEGRAFGGLRAERLPLTVCRSGIDRAYPRREPTIGCVNPEFHEPPDGGPFVVTVRDEHGA